MSEPTNRQKHLSALHDQPGEMVREAETWLKTLTKVNPDGGLIRCETDPERHQVVERLLRYARKDGMNEEDKLVVRTALGILQVRKMKRGMLVPIPMSNQSVERLEELAVLAHPSRR